ncbi:MAG: DUF2889 domain-containing protein [Gammaproteobacteria bacterium]|nr:DUF2889 domain-containing protein [Gammaproteobacteria bacterium]
MNNQNPDSPKMKSTNEDDSKLERTLIHTRDIKAQGFLRSDGLWDIEATLVDLKDYPFETIERGTLEPRQPVHDMFLRVTLDEEFVIQDIEAKTLAAPFQLCQKVPPRFKRLIGAQIGKGWRKVVQKELGGTQGCTHLIDMLTVIATVAYQTIHSYRIQQKQGAKIIHPSIIDQCQGFAADGEVVQTHFKDLVK